MIFVKKDDDYTKTRYLVDYHPYRKDGQKNPKFDKISGRILDLKQRNAEVIKIIADYLDQLLSQGITIAVVPSHDATKTDSGIRDVAKILAGNGRADASGCLVRTKTITKLTAGGDRSVQVHQDSITLVDAHLIKGAEVLLLDDVTTTGNSLMACTAILMHGGAKCVQCVAAARTSED